MKQLKRYTNRRLYDSETSKTVTLEDVAELILKGEEVRVFDNLTGEDITPKILGQTFLKVSLGQRNADFANFMLTSLIRETGKDISSLFGRLVLGGIGSQYLTRERLEKIVQSMVELGEIKPEQFKTYQDDLLQKLATRASERKDEIQKELSKLSLNEEDQNSTLEDLSSRIKEVAERIKDSNTLGNNA